MRSPALILLLIAFFLSVNYSHAQNFDLGIKGGINYASISEINSDGRIGYTGGAFFRFRFNALALQTEFLFSQQGGKFLGNRIETDYALIPVIMKLHFLRVFNLQFGPQFSYLLNGSDLLESEQIDISGAVGLGIILGSKLQMDIRYNYGFTDAFKGASGQNRFISFAFGLSFL